MTCIRDGASHDDGARLGGGKGVPVGGNGRSSARAVLTSETSLASGGKVTELAGSPRVRSGARSPRGRGLRFSSFRGVEKLKALSYTEHHEAKQKEEEGAGTLLEPANV